MDEDDEVLTPEQLYAVFNRSPNNISSTSILEDIIKHKEGGGYKSQRVKSKRYKHKKRNSKRAK